jgi:hypothetical protein
MFLNPPFALDDHLRLAPKQQRRNKIMAQKKETPITNTPITNPREAIESEESKSTPSQNPNPESDAPPPPDSP